MYLVSQKAIKQNIFSLTEFVKKMLSFDGQFDPNRLYKVSGDTNQPHIEIASNSRKKSIYSIGIGIEVANSFCTLYEAGSFIQALFLSIIGTYFYRCGEFDNLKCIRDETLLTQKIEKILLNIAESDLHEALLDPVINIVACADSDVLPIRYNKHHLWRLSPDVFHLRCNMITANDYAKSPLDAGFKNDYWVDDDCKISESIMQTGHSLPKLKAMQFYFVMKMLCEKMNVNLSNVPLFFSFLPKEELELSGPDSSFFGNFITFT